MGPHIGIAVDVCARRIPGEIVIAHAALRGRVDVVRVPAREAERLRLELQALGLVDRRLKMTKRGDAVLIPILRKPPVDLGAFGARIESVEGLESRPPPRDPVTVLRERFASAGIPLEFGPARWERIGDVLVLRFGKAATAHREKIAQIYAEVLGARTVVEDVSGIHGVLRTPEVRVLWGGGTETVHIEGSVGYKLDVARVMFSSGNLAERMGVVRLIRSGDVVVDLFAGIGYFTLPIAVHARPEAVYACELNPIAFQYLLENLRLNRVANVIPRLGDCRATAPRDVADVVLLGHFDARAYLDVAFATLRGTGLVVYHELAARERFPEDPLRHLSDAARTQWYDVESARARIVKSYAPGIVHAVVEARVLRRPKGP
jgi:tRNA wybutosine-synthesizing protein 2